MKLSVLKELSVMPWKACVVFSKDCHIHVDIQIWYPALGGRNPIELCLIFNSVRDFIYLRHRHRLRNWGMSPFLQPEWKGYAQVCRGSTPELFLFHRWNCVRDSLPKIRPVEGVFEGFERTPFGGQ